MCGIGGIVGDVARFDGAALLRALRHRGPDHQADAAPAPGVWLAAARLAISDPSPAGHQPMQSADGRVTLVYNGEIYNADRLRRELEGRGHVFRSRADTEVVLEGYRAFGEDVVERLDGMWAFALWDAARRRLLLARDPFGIKPLWLTRAHGTLAFASEVRALLAARAAPAHVSREAVRDYLLRGSVAEPAAIIAGIEALPPGHRLVVEDGVEARGRFFALPDGERAMPAAEAAALVRERLTEAVRGCFHADVEVGLLLSGGVDSAAIALLARGLGVRAFHVRLGAGPRARAAALARELGFAYDEVLLDGDEALRALPALLAAQDQPSVDGVNTWFIARGIHHAGLKAAVTGLGADELFLGYPLHRTYVRLRALQARAPRLLPHLERVAGALAGAPPLGWRVDKALGLAAALGPDETYAAARALFPPRAIAALTGAPPPRPAARALPAPSFAGELTRRELSGYLVDTLLRDADVMSMAHGVELRVPMLDRRLVEAVVPLAPDLKLRRGRRKPLLVDAVPGLEAAARAPKEGFELPLEAWLRGPLGPPVADLLGARDAALRVGLEPAAVCAVLDRFRRRGDRPSAFRVWALYSLLGWAAAHGASA